MSGNVVEAKLSLAIDQFNANSRAAAEEIRKLAREMNGSVAPAANEASGGIFKFSEILREHKAEHVQTTRAVGAFTKELEGLLGKKNEVATMLGSLAGGFAIGGAVGLAVESVKVLLEHFATLKKEAAEATKMSQEAIDKSGEQLQKLKDELAKLRGEDPEQDLIRGQIAAIDKLIAKRNELKAAIDKAEHGAEHFEAEKGLEEFDEQLKKSGKDLQTLLRLRTQAEQKLTIKTEIGTVQQGKKDESAAEKEREQWEKDFGPDGTIVKDSQKAWEKIEQYRQRSADYADKVNEEEREAWEKDFGPGGTVEKDMIKATETQQKYWQKSGEYAERVNDEIAQQQAKVWEHLSKSVSNAFSQGFTKALFHAKSFEDGVMSILDGLEKAFEQMVEQMIAKLVMSGILKLLGFLFGGPVGGMLGAEGGNLLGGLLGGGSVASLDVGTWNVPHDQLAYIHKGEIVVPPDISARVRAGQTSIGGGADLPAAQGATGGGDTFHVTVNAIDARSLYETLTGPSATGYLRAVAFHARNGRTG